MSLQIQLRVVGDVTILVCSGQITLGEATSHFRNTIRDLLKKGSRKLLLDLRAVTYLDSTGIGELVGAYTAATSASAKIRLLRLPEKIYELLQITKLVTLFEVYEDEQAAVRSFH